MDPLKYSVSQETKLHFLDYWRIIRIRKAIIITVFLITAIIATVVTFILPEQFASTTRIKVETDVNDITTLSGTPSASMSAYDPYFIQTTFEILQSEVVLSNVIARLDLNATWGKKYFGGTTQKTTDTMDLLKSRISLNPVRNTKLIAITVYSDDGKEAADLANAIADAYRDYRLNTRRQLTEAGVASMEKELRDKDKEIEDMQSHVDSLRKEYNIHGDVANATEPSSTITQEAVQRYLDQEIEGEKVYKQGKTQLDELKALDHEKLRDVLPTVTSDSALSSLLQKLHESQQTYKQLAVDYTPGDVHIQRVQSIIDELNKEIDDRVDGIMAALTSQVNSQKAALDTLKESVETAKASDAAEAMRSQPYWEAKRKLQSMIEFRNLLVAKVESERLDLQVPKTAMVQVVDPAEPGKDPVRPKKALNITLGLVFGLIMGVGLAFFIEYLDTSVKTIDDVERAFQAPVLGVIPQNVGYIIDEGPESKHAEAYRVLRTNILFSRKDEKLNTMVVVSAGAGEGKSTTTVNLATVFAQSGQRVLVVDSDLRRPTLHKIFRTTNNLGLTNYLLKQNTLAEVVHTSPQPMLDFMPSGKLPNSSMGVLGSAQMKELIAELKQRYDFIFFDSPPILGVSDASVLASEVDMVVQVIQYRRYPQPMNIRAKQMIEKVGGNFIGIALNNINMSQDESYYYYSGYYHDYYYSRTEGEQESAAKTGEPEGAAEGGIKQKY